MNNQSDNERLFADALADASPADFRDRLLGETLRLARRRRHVRQGCRAGIALGIVSAFALWLWPRTTPHPQIATPAPTNYRLIETQPLPASAIVITQPFTSPIVVSTAATSVITTAEVRNGLHILTDDELLSLAPGPAILVRLGPHSAELILADQSKTTAQ
jgi:hypothetical protein